MPKGLLILILLSIATLCSAQYSGAFRDSTSVSSSTWSESFYPLKSGTAVKGADNATNSRFWSVKSPLYITGSCHKVSGTLNAYLIIKYASGGTTPTVWIPKDTFVITNTTDQTFEFYDSDFEGSRFMIESKSAASGTQSLQWVLEWATKQED